MFLAPYIIAIDQGTTSSRVCLYSKDLKIISSAQKGLAQIYPDNGWVEHDPIIIFHDIITLIKQCINQACNVLNISPDVLFSETISIGITNQRETTILWNKTTGKPIHNAIVWQDRRTAEYCINLKKNNLESAIQEKTGLLIDPYFSASKINWLLKKYNAFNDPNILFGTIDTYLIWQLTDGKSHVTDATNASRTQLYNIHNLSWDQELLDIFNIPINILPEVKNSAGQFGVTAKHFFGSAIAICGVAGDQQAAAIGQLCYTEKSCKITYGTGCFVLENTGTKPIKSQHKLITTIAYLINNQPSYALEGSIFVAGAAVQWLRDAIKLITHASDTEMIAKNLTHNNGVYLVPAFTGLGAPYWDPQARGAILGLTRDTGFEHIVRAALESVCYQTLDLLQAFEQDYDLPTIIRVDGGMTANNWLLQFLADITQITIQKPKNTETTVKGAAILASLGANLYPLIDQLPIAYEIDQSYTALMPLEIRDNLHNGWLNAVKRLLQ